MECLPSKAERDGLIFLYKVLTFAVDLKRAEQDRSTVSVPRRSSLAQRLIVPPWPVCLKATRPLGVALWVVCVWGTRRHVQLMLVARCLGSKGLKTEATFPKPKSVSYLPGVSNGVALIGAGLSLDCCGGLPIEQALARGSCPSATMKLSGCATSPRTARAKHSALIGMDLSLHASKSYYQYRRLCEMQRDHLQEFRTSFNHAVSLMSNVSSHLFGFQVSASFPSYPSPQSQIPLRCTFLIQKRQMEVCLLLGTVLAHSVDVMCRRF